MLPSILSCHSIPTHSIKSFSLEQTLRLSTSFTSCKIIRGSTSQFNTHFNALHSQSYSTMFHSKTLPANLYKNYFFSVLFQKKMFSQITPTYKVTIHPVSSSNFSVKEAPTFTRIEKVLTQSLSEKKFTLNRRRGFDASSYRTLTTLPPSSQSGPFTVALGRMKKVAKTTKKITVKKLTEAVVNCQICCVKFGTTLIEMCKNPKIIIQWSIEIKEKIIHGYHWTRRGFRMFGANFKVSLLLAKKKMKGQPLSYREHKLLVRTTSDLVKLIPFSFFVVVPFAELLLPIALWLFPGMLPSTFSERQIDNPHWQRKLKAKQELAQFFQELVAERTRKILDESTCDRSKDRARVLKEFQEKLILKAKQEAGEDRLNETKNSEAHDTDEVNPFLSLKETLTYAKLFREEFKLENMPTKALMVLCRMLGLQPYGIRANIILQLRHHILRLQREDREILWEGVDSLSHDELSDACRERAMRFYGVSDEVMKDQMSQWLALSSHSEIPPLLLLWSRSITMTHIAPEKPLTTEQLDSDELLPKIEEELLQGENNEKEKKLQEELDRIDLHLEELKVLADVLEKEQKQPPQTPSSSTSGTSPESLPDSIQAEKLGVEEDSILNTGTLELHDSDPIGRAERIRASKEALIRKTEKLEKEMHLLRKVSELQHEQISLVVRTLANLIDDYRGSHKYTRHRHTKSLEDFVNRLERTLSTFEQGVGRISNVLETAKCLHLSGEDEAFYPDDAQETIITLKAEKTVTPPVSS